MLAKILCANDFHRRPTDITTIKGYVKCNEAVHAALCDELRRGAYTHMILGGDWYDKGYAADIGASLADTDADIEMAKIVNGNVYTVIGNHLRLRMDSNPELSLIQPHPVLKSRKPVTRKEQIFKTPEVLRIGDVQISFMHHKKGASDPMVYKPTRQPWAKYHIAVFHSPLVVPASKLIDTEYAMLATPTSVISRLLEGVDYAYCGDIHNVLGQFVVPTTTGNCIMCVPGSLTNTNAGLAHRHTSVALPILEIDDDSTVKISYLPFDLKTNLLEFSDKAAAAIEKSKKLKTLAGKPVAALHDEEVNITLNNNDIKSFTAYMQTQNYSDTDKAIVRAVLSTPDNLDSIIKAYKKDFDDM